MVVDTDSVRMASLGEGLRRAIPQVQWLYIGIADGMLRGYGRVGTQNDRLRERRSFGVPARPYARNEHAVGDADIEPIQTVSERVNYRGGGKACTVLGGITI